MNSIFRKALYGLIGIVAVFATFAWSQTRNFPPRLFLSQQTHYIRINATFNAINGTGCVLVSGSCTVLVGAVPYNSFIVRGYQQIITSFNSGTQDSLSVGVTSANANELVVAEGVRAAPGGATSLTIVAANLGITATGNGATQTGGNGGFGIWVKYAQTGAAPTAGQAILVLEYFAPNDGTCTAVPMNATAGAC